MTKAYLVATAPRKRKATIDTWSSQPLMILQTPRSTVMLWLLAIPAVLPIALLFPALVTLNGSVLYRSGNDVLGTGAELALFVMLAVTPLRTLTRRQWFVPLRRWYGIMFAADSVLGGIIASNDPGFSGGPVAELGGHAFLLTGTLMVLLLIPLLVMGIWNRPTMKALGAHWKPVQKYGTFGIWAVLAVHLMLLEGFGPSHADAAGPDRFPFDVLHQRFYQFLGCSVFLLVLRLPPVRRRIRGWQLDGDPWKAWLVIVPLAILFAIAFGYLVNELFYTGIGAARLAPVSS